MNVLKVQNGRNCPPHTACYIVTQLKRGISADDTYVIRVCLLNCCELACYRK